MKIIKKYILSEYLSSTLFGLVVFTFILLLDQIFQVVNMIISKGVDAADAMTLFALMLPNIFSLSVPISSLFGGIISYGRLSADNEITALKTAGIGYWNFMLPPVIFSAALACLLVFYNLDVSPATYKKFSQEYFELVQKRPTLKLEEKSIIELGNNKIYFEKKDASGLLRNVNIFQFEASRGPLVPTVLITASYAIVSIKGSNVLFQMHDGIIQKSDINKPDETTHLKFSRYDVAIPLDYTAHYTKTLREYTAKELLDEIKSYRKSRLPTNIFETEYNLRVTVGLAPFFFTIIGIPLGLISNRGTKSVGFAISAAVIFAFYVFLAIGINFSDKGYLPSAVSLQIPNAATFVFAVLLWRRTMSR